MLKVVTFDERVVLAAQFGRQRAIHYLLKKWEAPKNRLVTALAQQFGLREEDAADARQEAVFWIMDAIRNYKFTGPAQFRERRLKAFLRVVLRRRMLNFVRGVHRKSRVAKACCDRKHPVGHAIVSLTLARRRLLDPELLCANQELIETTQQRILVLGDQCGQLFEMLQTGVSMREVSEQLQISCHQLRKLRLQIEQALSPVRKPK